MRLTLERLVAIVLLVVPGLLATHGFLMMKDSLFLFYAQYGESSPLIKSFAWDRFLLGLMLFLFGLSFLGGWIFCRDRKHNYGNKRSPKF